jgi:hypothetical protein
MNTSSFFISRQFTNEKHNLIAKNNNMVVGERMAESLWKREQRRCRYCGETVHNTRTCTVGIKMHLVAASLNTIFCVLKISVNYGEGRGYLLGLARMRYTQRLEQSHAQSTIIYPSSRKSLSCPNMPPLSTICKLCHLCCLPKPCRFPSISTPFHAPSMQRPFQAE